MQLEYLLKAQVYPLTKSVIPGKLLPFSLSLSFLICQLGIMVVLIYRGVFVRSQTYKVIKPSTVTNIYRLAK